MIKSLKDNLAIVLIVILAAVPLVLWYSMKPLALRFETYSTTFRSLGQITGLLGMALISINFILSARFKFLDKWFNGLNRVYMKHHTIGVLAFCLILFHPTFLTIQYLLISLKSSFIFIFYLTDWPTNFGKIALLIFMVLMVITLYLHFKYQNWKSTHKYLGLVLLFAGLHMLLVPSDISNNALLEIYMLALASLGAISYFYRTILGVYKKKEYKYRLEEVIKVNENVVELKLKPLADKINYMPGQFVFIRFDLPAEALAKAGHNDVLSESHPFSITSSPADDDLSLGIKTLGDYTSMVYLLKPGVVCRVEGPFGSFSHAKAVSKRQIWIAGGIGITPFLGMARHIVGSGAVDYKIDLYYSVKNESEAAFAEELTEITRRNSNFKLHQHFSDKEGHISAGLIVKYSGDLPGADIFLCGPPVFMQSMRSQFLKLGISDNKIHSEEFNLSI